MTQLINTASTLPDQQIQNFLTVSEWIQFYQNQGGNKIKGGYVSSAKTFLGFCNAQFQGLISELALENFCFGKSASYRSMVRNFYFNFFEDFSAKTGFYRVKLNKSELPPALNEWILRYISDKRKSNEIQSKKTAKDYIQSLNFFFQELFDGEQIMFTRYHIHEFLENRRDNGKSVFTLNRDLSILKGFAGWLDDNFQSLDLPESYLRELSQIQKIKSYKKDENLGQYKYVLNRAERDLLLETPNKTWWALMLIGGLRANEVLSLDLSKDFDRNRKLLYIQGKGRTGKSSIAVFPELFNLLSQNTKIEPPKSYAILRKALINDCTNVGIYQDKLTLHSLRHTCASLMIEEGIGIELVQQHLRHKSIDTTLVYTKNQIRKEYEKLKS